jgi:predicted amidohydrolase
MSRKIVVGAAQLGPVQRADSKGSVVERMLALMAQAKTRGCDLVVFPELALTTFFPRHFIDDQAELHRFFEKEVPGPDTQPLFDLSEKLGIGFYLGYAELAEDGEELHRYNSSIIVDKRGRIAGRYRKIHLPGTKEFTPRRTADRQNFEKRYFEVGNLGLPVYRAFGGLLGMCLCNDRRWPETYRVMGLQGVEMIMLGYNTGAIDAWGAEPPHVRMLQNHIVMQAGAYQNGTWVVGVAKAGTEDGSPLMGGSVIISPTGLIVAEAVTVGDELIVAECDLDTAAAAKTTVLNFERNRQPQFYRPIVEQTGIKLPD